MRTIASLLMTAKHLKRFGSQDAAERQLARIIAHPDFEHVCTLINAFQSLNILAKTSKDVPVDNDLNEQDVEDLGLDVDIELDDEDVRDTSLNVDDHIKEHLDADLDIELDMDESGDDLPEESEIEHKDSDTDADDFVIEIDIDGQDDVEIEDELKPEHESTEDLVETEDEPAKLVEYSKAKEAAHASLKAKLAVSKLEPKKIVVSKSKILAKKRSLS